MTFIDYLIEAKHIGYNPEFVFANKQVFDADMAINPNDEQAQKIISKIQRPKIEALAQLLDVRWTMLFANSHDQHDRWRGTSRLVWSYILVGNDKDGNEIAYYKYEAGPGSGQSHVYGNRKNKTKLTWVLDSTPTEAKARLGLVAKDKPSEAVPTDEKDLVRLLKRKFKGAAFIRDGQDRLRMFIRYPTSTKKWMRAQRGISFLFKPYRGKMIVKYQQLYGAKEVRKGYDDERYSGPSKLGTFEDVVSMIQKMRLKRDDLK